MNFANAVARRMQAALPREFQEYPKWVRWDENEALVSDANEEAAILASWGFCADSSPPATAPDKVEEPSSPAPFNLLSQPEKRGRKIISLK